jgi:hypothetical protein
VGNDGSASGPTAGRHGDSGSDPYAGRRDDSGTGIAGYDSDGNPIYNPPEPANAGDGGWDGGSDPFDDGDPGAGYGGGDDRGCVAVASFLPDGRTAGQVKVGDTMELGDEETMETTTGVVSYSTLMEARGYRITTESGASLVCSDTAPVPARGKGLLTPAELLGEQVAVRWDESGSPLVNWETVTKVEEVGMIQVQHITVGDRCFWAGEKKAAYILHHNMKQAGGQGGGGYDWPWPSDDPLKSNPNQPAHHSQVGGDAAIIVGAPHALPIDSVGFM